MIGINIHLPSLLIGFFLGYVLFITILLKINGGDGNKNIQYKDLIKKMEEDNKIFAREIIMEYLTDGTDEWALKRKEKLVRCKNCNWWDESSYECSYNNKKYFANDFCSCGEEKNK